MGGEVLIGDTALDTFQAVGRNMRCSPVFEEKGTGRVYLLRSKSSQWEGGKRLEEGECAQPAARDELS